MSLVVGVEVAPMALVVGLTSVFSGTEATAKASELSQDYPASSEPSTVKAGEGK